MMFLLKPTVEVPVLVLALCGILIAMQCFTEWLLLRRIRSLVRTARALKIHIKFMEEELLAAPAALERGGNT